MILRTELWDRRRKLCKQFGFRAAIIYDQPEHSWTAMTAPACEHRLRTKTWLFQKHGSPQFLNHRGEWINSGSEWLQLRRRDQNEYVIAVKDPRLINWLLLL